MQNAFTRRFFFGAAAGRPPAGFFPARNHKLRHDGHEPVIPSANGRPWRSFMGRNVARW